jgi:hypothetical protein
MAVDRLSLCANALEQCTIYDNKTQYNYIAENIIQIVAAAIDRYNWMIKQLLSINQIYNDIDLCKRYANQSTKLEHNLNICYLTFIYE